jgi:hypothetical protein
MIAVVSFALWFAALAIPAPVLAASPWWHLSTAARPTDLQPARARDEVQQLTVAAHEGMYVVEDGASSTMLEAGESPRAVQEALEGRGALAGEMYGTGNVEVIGKPGPNSAFEVYEVKFVGKLADRPVGLMGARALVMNGEVTVVELVEGRVAGLILVTAVNLGDASANATQQPITLEDVLPPGLEAVSIEGEADEELFRFHENEMECSLSSLSCTFTGQTTPLKAVAPYEQIQMRIAVDLRSDTKFGENEVNRASVTGGEAASVTAKGNITASNAPISFAMNTYEMRPEEEGGGVDTQAGSHPFQLTTTIMFNETWESGEPLAVKPAALTKDLHFKLPAGLIGNPTPIVQCRPAIFLAEEGIRCPTGSILGVARALLSIHIGRYYKSIPWTVPLYNLEPAGGEPARFAFMVHGTPVILNTAIRTGEDYGVTVNVTNISQTAEFIGSEVTFWGTPGDARHDDQRGECLDSTSYGGNEVLCGKSETLNVLHPPPFLSMPTSCAGALRTVVEGDSWKEPLAVQSLSNTAPMPATDGCGRLPDTAEINVTPDVQEASKPSGLTVDVHVPQEEALNAKGLAPSDLKNITVALPEGVALNPAAGDGLQACSEEQFGLSSDTEASCPNASKIANVTIRTPLLPNPLTGFVYLATPQNFAGPAVNPFSSLVAMYLVARDPVSGVLVKLPGKITLSGTGQILATFENNPQLPFEDAELSYFGGERAPLVTPTRCGTYTTNASFAPWSGEEAVSGQSHFEITAGPNGGPCANPAPFSPSLASGTTNINSGTFSELTTTLSREDGEQQIQSVQVHYPPGLSGLLKGVKLCGEAEANAGTCGAESQIGETIVSVGLGGDPFTVSGGKVFITGPYEGASFGLSITNPAKAGPFDLQEGRPVVVRAKVEVNSTTAALTITTDPPGSPHAIPTIIEGFPLQIKHVNVLINRPGFTFNPTNCAPMAITGAIYSAEGASAPVQVPFQVTNCASLKFAPKFAAATSGKTSRAGGASLAVKLSYPAAALGSQANIAWVKVELPKRLPSRLTTLQKACTAAQFKANPAGCPAASMVGRARAITPLVPVPLEGPAYFVSNGNEAFPNLIIVLQGYGVTIDLVGSTFISKTGITSSTFKTIPDAPVGSFELTLPEGPYSALAANASLCKGKLTMPTEIVAQNGAEIHQTTKIAVTGCPKARPSAKHNHQKAKHKGKSKSKNKSKNRGRRG